MKSPIFRTEVTPTGGNFNIDYRSKILCVGSCFVKNIGQKLQYYKYPTLLNPFGVLYNPASIGKAFDTMLDERKAFTKSDVFEHQGVWNSFCHHSDYSDVDRDRHLEKINQQLQSCREWLKETDVIIITLGTAFVYEYLQTKEIVSNCHKLPEKEFKRYMLSIEKISGYLEEVINNASQLNGNIQFLFTVSPVRHLRDGADQNQLSKSSLMVGVNNVVNRYKHAHYFPSYEIMMDDLRDYRFYNEDMVHPNRVAIDYIWKKFKDSYVSKKAAHTMEKVEKIQQAVSHRPRFPESKEHQKFVENIIRQMESLPDIDFSAERQQLLNKTEANN